MLGSEETPPRAPPTGARVAIQAIRWSLDGERANDDDRDAVFDTASVVPYRISAKHLVTLYWISPISKWVDYQHSALLTNPYQPPSLLTFFKSVDYQHSALPALVTQMNTSHPA